jgi:GMP synthase-like glutamine amidotransferase
LQDNKFVEDIEGFEWLKDFNKPVLGICAGMQIMGKVFGGEIKKKTEIGYFKEDWIEDFLGLREEDGIYPGVWHLHNNYVTFDDGWKVFAKSGDADKIPQAVKHKAKPFYGVLFHPEVRQRELVRGFVGL